MNANTGWRGPNVPPKSREPIFNLPPVILALIGVCALVYVLQSWFLTTVQYQELMFRAAFFPARYSNWVRLDIYAFTSPFTHTFLHGSLSHLAVNMIWLAIFGSPLANRLGNGRFLLFWAVTGLAAVWLHYMLHSSETVPLIGASGAISGMMGAAARFGFRIDRSTGQPAFAGQLLRIVDVPRSRTVMVFLAVWMAVNLATGLGGAADADRIAWEAHIGGFLAGFFAIDLFVRSNRAW